MRNYIFILFILFFSFSGNTQELISLEKAVSIALNKNHNVLAVKMNKQIAANNVTRGNAGMLPQVGVKGGLNGGVSNSTTEFLGGQPDLDVNGAVQVSSNASIYANYTLFNGFKAQNTYQQFKGKVDLVSVQSQLAIENTLMLVINNYYQLVYAQEQVNVLKEAFDISKQRYKRVQAKVEFGSSNSLDLLNAQVDLNTDSVNYINAKLAQTMASNNLAYLLGEAKMIIYQVDTGIQFSLPLSLPELEQKAKENNSSLLVAVHTLSLSEKQLKLIQAVQYPVISLNTSFGYNQNANSGSFIKQSQSTGLSGGLALSYNLFNGGQARINAQNAKITIESNLEKRLDAEAYLTKEVNNVYRKYMTYLQIVEVQKNNLKTAQLNFEKSKVAFNIGQISTTQFRTAQVNLIRSELNITKAKYDAILSEMDLMRLTGMLINE